MPEIMPPPIPKAVGVAAGEDEGPHTPKTPVDKALIYSAPGLALGTVLGLKYAPATTGRVLHYATGLEKTATGSIVPKPFALLYLAPQPIGVVPPKEFDLRPGYLYEVSGGLLPESTILQVLPPDAPEVEQFRREREARLGKDAPPFDPTRVVRLYARNVVPPGPVQGVILLAQSNRADNSAEQVVGTLFGGVAESTFKFLERDLRGQNESTQRTANHPLLPDLHIGAPRRPAPAEPPASGPLPSGFVALPQVTPGGFVVANVKPNSAVAQPPAAPPNQVDGAGNIPLRDP